MSVMTATAVSTSNVDRLVKRAKAQKAALKSVETRQNRSADYFDPTTSNREYTSQEREFLRAADAYQRENSKAWMTATDYFRVMQSLGYNQTGHFG